MIKNKLSAKLLAEIPDGKSESKKSIRKSIIRRELEALRNKTFKNPSFPIGITVTEKGIGEIAQHASNDRLSTIAALHLKYVLNNATVTYIGLPKYGKQSDTFAAWITIVMHCNIEDVGSAKLTIVDNLKKGEKGKLDLLAYCLTKTKE